MTHNQSNKIKLKMEKTIKPKKPILKDGIEPKANYETKSAGLFEYLAR
jgi:hypothetical protein